MQPGIYGGIPEDDYHASPGISVSRLKKMQRCPAYARFNTTKETTSLKIGSLFHCALLEPTELEKRYYVTDLKRISDREKATQAEQQKAGTRELIQRSDYDNALRMRDAVFSNSSVIRDLLTPELEVEQSFYWNDPETGVLCRGRTDGMNRRMKVMIDIKSTTDARPEPFSKTAADYDYDWQHVYYCDGLPLAGGFEPEAFFFIAIEKEPPYLVWTHEIAPDDVELARGDVRHHLDQWAECERTDTWPRYPELPTLLRMPPWKRNS